MLFRSQSRETAQARQHGECDEQIEHALAEAGRIRSVEGAVPEPGSEHERGCAPENGCQLRPGDQPAGREGHDGDDVEHEEAGHHRCAGDRRCALRADEEQDDRRTARPERAVEETGHAADRERSRDPRPAVRSRRPQEQERGERDDRNVVLTTLAERTGSAQRRAAPFVVLERFHLAIAVVTVIASSVFLLALMLMLVEERRATVGVLRLIGFRRARILQHVLAEGVVIALAGAVFGIVLSVVMQDGINRFFQWRYDTALVFVQIGRAHV